MDRRRFLQNLAASAAAAGALEPLVAAAQAAAQRAGSAGAAVGRAVRSQTVNVDGHTLVCEFTEHALAGAAHAAGRVGSAAGQRWKVYEDLQTREGVITLVGAGGETYVLPKSAEAQFAEEGAPFLGLNIEEIGLSGRDLLAEKLLEGGGDPDPMQVRAAAPPQGSGPQQGQARGRWVTFVGTKEAYDVAPVYPGGSTRTWLPTQFFSELRELRPPMPTGGAGTAAGGAGAAAGGAGAAGGAAAGAAAGGAGAGGAGAGPIRGQGPVEQHYHGLVGGWMPAARTIVELSSEAYIEHIVFGDVLAADQFIVQTWHRSAKVERGAITKVVYGYTYPPFPPARRLPAAEAFYRGLLAFVRYWDAQLHECSPASLPDRAYVDMARHSFVKELMIRPGGVSPKYGAVDRDYFGSEYDGFQDIFTSALYANLEWGRFETARVFLDDYFTKYVEPNGMINMRGPETAQFGLTLSLLARYAWYTRDVALLDKHRAKIAATAKVLTDLQDISLALPAGDESRGLIRGWSESDSCLHPDPSVWWQPYYANSAFAARGLRDMASVADVRRGSGAGAGEVRARGEPAWDGRALEELGRAWPVREWRTRSEQLQKAVVASMQAHFRGDLNPPYMPPMPGARLPFREAMEKERPSPQQWPHRLYAELLQADVLPADLAGQTIDTLRQYGGTTLGVVANIGIARPGARSILGFISYGYAQMLLRLDRVEEYLLFLHAHRYHDHTRGSWTAGEVSGIRGGTALFCIPAQHTIPLLVRWMLVLEDSDEDRLFFGRAIPRAWNASGPVSIQQAPTRWGRVNFSLAGGASASGASAGGSSAGGSSADGSSAGASSPGGPASRGAGKRLVATVELARAGAPAEVQVSLRAPQGSRVVRATVNGRAATLGGRRGDAVMIKTAGERRFEVVGELG